MSHVSARRSPLMVGSELSGPADCREAGAPDGTAHDKGPGLGIPLGLSCRKACRLMLFLKPLWMNQVLPAPGVEEHE